MKSHVTIIPVDQMIQIDNQPLFFTFPRPENIHAIQWHNGAGEIEFNSGQPNQALQGPEDYNRQVKPYVDLWQAEKNRLQEEASRPPTPEQLAEAARSQRDNLLASCDWTQLPDSPLSNEEKAAWSEYRQALRDISGQAGFPGNITWPRVPGEED